MLAVDHNARMNKAPSFGHSGFLMESPAALQQSASRRVPALVAALLWLAAGLSAGYWVLQFLGRSAVTPVATVALAPAPPDPLAVARTLGAVPVAAVGAAPAAGAPARYVLLGVVATGTDGGAALIAVDSQPPRPYRVGAALDGGLVLQAVTRRTVRLGPSLDAPTSMELSVPEPPATPS
jgi:general secretion pathway protein C